MNDSQERESREYALRFGEIAINLGLITLYQLNEALTEQISSTVRPRKLIGEILFERGWMNFNQIETVLKEIVRKQHEYFL